MSAGGSGSRPPAVPRRLARGAGSPRAAEGPGSADARLAPPVAPRFLSPGAGCGPDAYGTLVLPRASTGVRGRRRGSGGGAALPPRPGARDGGVGCGRVTPDARLDDFLVRAALAGVGTAIAAVPPGRLASRGAAWLASATPPRTPSCGAWRWRCGRRSLPGVLATSVAMALAVQALSRRAWAVDTLLGVMAHSALAFGLVAASLLEG